MSRVVLRSQSYGGPVFLLVDNAEDPASGSYAQGFDDLISKVRKWAAVCSTTTPGC